jgi:hypothetical protein
MFEEGVLAHCFPMRIELVGERDSYYLSTFMLGESLIFEKYLLQT